MLRYIKSSRPDRQQRNASRPIKASVKAASEQPSVAMLASLGIKVRDFAYESKLPPIQPIYRHPRQIQPAVVRTTLKRQYTEPGEDDFFSQSSSQSRTSQKKLERTSTEPVIPPDPGPSAGGFNEYDSLQIDSQQSNIHPESSQVPPSNFESQESEPYVDTPPVTPRGPLRWPVPDTSNMPASQLDTESQTTAQELPPWKFSPVSDTLFSPKRSPISSPSSPLASALSLASIDDSLPLSKTPPQLAYGKTATATSLDQRPGPTSPRVLAMRYHLRKRPTVPSSPLSSTTKSSRLHSLRPRSAVIPPAAPHCTSIQSSHSRSKPKDGPSSPSPRSLLRRAVTNGQEKRRRTS